MADSLDTVICTTLEEDAGPTNNWMSPPEGYRRAGEIFAGSMRGRTMYVIPFSMGPVGSPFSKIGVELTDSIYVVLNMRIMTHVGKRVLKQLGTRGEFTRCLHGRADLDIKRRLILHFPEDNAIWSVGSGYGGNVLLGKKCLALRIASHLGRSEGWLAEHVLIMGVESPEGRIEYVAAAFPSACGKTNLAMLIPPEGLKVKGYRVWTVGDDIAWMRIDTDGRLWAINPETGFFGVAPGTNFKTNSNMIRTIRQNTIFTNVVLGQDGTVWWEGLDGLPPQEAWDWQGRPWKPGLNDDKGNPIVGAHPNSRYEEGKFLWPGFGENLRVIEWVLDRCRGEADAVKTPIGYVPTPDSLDLTGLDISRETLNQLFAVDRNDWYQETDGMTSFFQQFGNRLPKAMWEQLDGLRLRLRAPLSLMQPGTELRPLATELNEVIERENTHVFSMLSDFGKRLYFPKGILAQSAEAKEKAKRYDATIGIARENKRVEKRGILEARAKKVTEILASPNYAKLWEPYPFNSGYFMCLKLKGIDAETYRKHLLDKYGIGVIADGQQDIRVAFSAVDEDHLQDLYDKMAAAARDLHDA